MNELEQYIKAENDRYEAEGWSGRVVEDAAHWAEYGIYTIEDYQKYMISCSIDELHKEVYGCKLRQGWKDISMEDLEATLQSLIKSAERHREEEAQQEQEAVKDFEAKIAELIECGAGDRITAIKWLYEGENDRYMDQGYFEYILRIPYNYLDKDWPAVSELLAPMWEAA